MLRGDFRGPEHPFRDGLRFPRMDTHFHLRNFGDGAARSRADLSTPASDRGSQSRAREEADNPNPKRKRGANQRPDRLAIHRAKTR